MSAARQRIERPRVMGAGIRPASRKRQIVRCPTWSISETVLTSNSILISFASRRARPYAVHQRLPNPQKARFKQGKICDRAVFIGCDKWQDMAWSSLAGQGKQGKYLDSLCTSVLLDRIGFIGETRYRETNRNETKLNEQPKINQHKMEV